MPTILLTRPAPASEEFAAKLKTRLGDVEIVTSPLLRIDWRTPALGDGTPIFTSRNGVEGFVRAGGKAQGRCWCVGSATAMAATTAGFVPYVADGDADALVGAILQSGARGPFLHLRGAHARGDVAERLRAQDLTAEEAVVYDQIAQDLGETARNRLGSEKPVVVPLFSPRTAAQFARSHVGDAPLYVAAMSRAVAEALSGLDPAAVLVADRPDAEAMLEATERLFDAALQLEAVQGAK